MSKSSPPLAPRRVAKPWRWFALVAIVGLLAGLWWSWKNETPAVASPPLLAPPVKLEIAAGMVRIEGGEFWMGNDHAGEIDQRPMHLVRLRAFWLDQHEVTNAQFAEFIHATSYVTTAEQVGQAQVFDPLEHKWAMVAGADWRHPRGHDSSILGRDDQPVVQVSWHDARAYASWAKKRLPTEAEWEYAARGGLHDADYPWGRAATINGRPQANTWQGWFPDKDSGGDGFRDLAPVGSFAPNRFGLYDMSGNVWEWCADWYADDEYQRLTADNPTGPAAGRERIRRGGSWLCAENSSAGPQVSTRDRLPPTAASNHVGFRCARDARPARLEKE